MRLAPVAIALALVLGTLSIASSALAQTSQVVLNDGSVVRGVVVSYEPGVRVVMRLPDGFVREIPADQIQSADFQLMPMPAPRASAWLGDPDAGVDEAERPPERARRPVRFGAQLGFGTELYDHRWIGPGGYADLGLVLEIRPVWRLHVRATFSVWTDGRDSFAAEGGSVHLGMVGGRGRVFVGLDLPYRIAVRLGGELGFAYASVTGQGDVVLPTGGGLLEVGWRAIAGFELAFVFGIVTRTGRYVRGMLSEDHAPVGARLGLHVEYLF